MIIKTSMPSTPELDRQSDIIKSGKAETVQDFIDWFQEQGLHLSKFGVREYFEDCPGANFLADCHNGVTKPGTHSEQTCTKCKGTGYITVEREGHWDDGRGPQKLMDDFFDIDENKIETERRAILEAIRQADKEQS